MTQNHLEEDKKAACKWAYELLQRNDWCVLDTETTNLDGIAVEIAAIAPDGTVLFNSLINPDGAAIHAKARAAHKLTDEELASAPTLPEVWTQLLTALESYKTIITYNAVFDKNILTRHAQRYKLPVLTHAWECAMERYAEYYGDWNDWHESYRWQPLNGGHRALGDAQAALKRIHEMASYHVPETNNVSMNNQDEPLSEEAIKIVQDYFAALKDGICHVCRQKVERKEQKGRCVYAQPCGHRLYQGTLPKEGK